MCTVKNNDKNRMNLPPPSFHSFPNCGQTTKTLKFSEFQFVCEKVRAVA